MTKLNGYAQVMTVPPNVKYADLFASLQKTARDLKLGLWSAQTTQSTQSTGQIVVYITKTGNKYHRAGCRYLSKDSIVITLEEAKKKGYTLCSVCNPPK